MVGSSLRPDVSIAALFRVELVISTKGAGDFVERILTDVLNLQQLFSAEGNKILQ